jgi:hypothetical protein
MKLLAKIISKIDPRGSQKKNSWKNIERFNDAWKERIKFMAQFIERKDSVIVDLGCGPMWLKDNIKEDSEYFGVDYKDRGRGTLICDFNKYQFPEVNADIYFVSGCMEYVLDWRWFVKAICGSTNKCIISYCSLDNVGDAAKRAKHAWVSGARKEEIIYEFNRHDMLLRYQNDFDSNNTVFVFIRK